METSTTSSRRVSKEKRLRTEYSCDKCKTRKQKCDRLLDQDQCRYCEIHNITCTTTQPRKRRIQGSVEGLGNRLALLESLVKGLLPEADLSSIDEMQQLGKSLGIPLPLVEDGYVDVEKSVTKQDNENVLPLLPDQAGQSQYIGPSSSFGFHLRLRKLMGNYSTVEFAMFGRNAAEQDDNTDIYSSRRGITALSTVPVDHGSPSDAVREIDGPILEALIDAYFDNIHADFPVLHESSFRQEYEAWSRSTVSADPSWLCGLLVVLILARRVARISVPLDAEQKWWTHVKALLPIVVFTSNVFAIQALMLAGLHLHNDTHRDACWNLTGTAVRIAFAIGLHRDDLKNVQSLLNRELRKQLWWTLYAFEHMQVSSYDRPSAIGHAGINVGCPNERIVGVAGNCPPEYTKWSQRLVTILGSACRALNPDGKVTTGVEDAYSRPLSPSAAILRDLNRWKEGLPPHLQMDATDSLAPSSKRQLLLLHAQFYYIMVLISRGALLRRATVMAKNPRETLPQIHIEVSDTCIDSGRQLSKVMRKLEQIQQFNSLTWWDIFYTTAAALVLVLDIMCAGKQQQHRSKSSESLQELGSLAKRALLNPRLPGSMHKWASVVVEVSEAADQMFSPPTQPQNGRSCKLDQDVLHVALPRAQEKVIPAEEFQPDTSDAGHEAATLPKTFVANLDNGFAITPNRWTPSSFEEVWITDDPNDQLRTSGSDMSQIRWR